MQEGREHHCPSLRKLLCDKVAAPPHLKVLEPIIPDDLGRAEGQVKEHRGGRRRSRETRAALFRLQGPSFSSFLFASHKQELLQRLQQPVNPPPPTAAETSDDSHRRVIALSIIFGYQRAKRIFTVFHVHE